MLFCFFRVAGKKEKKETAEEGQVIKVQLACGQSRDPLLDGTCALVKCTQTTQPLDDPSAAHFNKLKSNTATEIHRGSKLKI